MMNKTSLNNFPITTPLTVVESSDHNVIKATIGAPKSALLKAIFFEHGVSKIKIIKNESYDENHLVFAEAGSRNEEKTLYKKIETTFGNYFIAFPSDANVQKQYKQCLAKNSEFKINEELELIASQVGCGFSDLLGNNLLVKESIEKYLKEVRLGKKALNVLDLSNHSITDSNRLPKNFGLIIRSDTEINLEGNDFSKFPFNLSQIPEHCSGITIKCGHNPRFDSISLLETFLIITSRKGIDVVFSKSKIEEVFGLNNSKNIKNEIDEETKNIAQRRKERWLAIRNSQDSLNPPNDFYSEDDVRFNFPFSDDRFHLKDSVSQNSIDKPSTVVKAVQGLSLAVAAIKTDFEPTYRSFENHFNQEDDVSLASKNELFNAILLKHRAILVRKVFDNIPVLKTFYEESSRIAYSLLFEFSYLIKNKIGAEVNGNVNQLSRVISGIFSLSSSVAGGMQVTGIAPVGTSSAVSSTGTIMNKLFNLHANYAYEKRTHMARYLINDDDIGKFSSMLARWLTIVMSRDLIKDYDIEKSKLENFHPKRAVSDFVSRMSGTKFIAPLDEHYTKYAHRWMSCLIDFMLTKSYEAAAKESNTSENFGLSKKKYDEIGWIEILQDFHKKNKSKFNHIDPDSYSNKFISSIKTDFDESISAYSFFNPEFLVMQPSNDFMIESLLTLVQDLKKESSLKKKDILLEMAKDHLKKYEQISNEVLVIKDKFLNEESDLLESHMRLSNILEEIFSISLGNNDVDRINPSNMTEIPAFGSEEKIGIKLRKLRENSFAAVEQLETEQRYLHEQALIAKKYSHGARQEIIADQVNKSPDEILTVWNKWAEEKTPRFERRAYALLMIKTVQEKGLRTLNLSNLNLSDVPSIFPQNLAYIDLSKNRLRNFPENLPNEINTLRLNENKISKWPARFPNKLFLLNLSANRIRDFSESVMSIIPLRCSIALHDNLIRNKEKSRLSKIALEKGFGLHFYKAKEINTSMILTEYIAKGKEVGLTSDYPSHEIYDMLLDKWIKIEKKENFLDGSFSELTDYYRTLVGSDFSQFIAKRIESRKLVNIDDRRRRQQAAITRMGLGINVNTLHPSVLARLDGSS